MRRFLLLALLFCLAAWPARASEKPNIVFILADDLGIHDLACYGRKEHPTPHLDRLAQQGLRFTNAYVAQPLCSPTRAAILTGKAPARLKLTTYLPGRFNAPAQLLSQAALEPQLLPNELTLADRLRTAGYATALIGKWHLGGKGCLPTDRGFDVYYPGKALTKPSATEGGKGEFELTEQATKFIETNKDRPFFLYIGHYCPHIPLVAKEALIAKHKDAFNPTYAAMIETLDEAVGRVVAKLEELKLGEKTIVVFTSDNGGLHVPEGSSTLTPATFHRVYRGGKGFLYEGGLRIPLIARWTGRFKAGEVIDTPVISTDWTPTFLSLTGVESKAAFDGESLSDLMLRGVPLAPRPLFWHFPHYSNQGGMPAGAIREGNWKLIEHYESGGCELFQLADDPGEAKDLGAQEPARVADLRGKLEAWRRTVGAEKNKANPNYNYKLIKPLFVDFDASRLAESERPGQHSTALSLWRKSMDAAAKDPPGIGAILLQAQDAKVHGNKLRFEPQPHKDTLGFWVQQDDWAEWQLQIARPGVYQIEVLQGCGKGSGGAEIEISLAGQKLTMEVEDTGHFQRFVPRTVGTVGIEAAGPHTLEVRAKSKPGPAVMDLRRILLRGITPY